MHCLFTQLVQRANWTVQIEELELQKQYAFRDALHLAIPALMHTCCRAGETEIDVALQPSWQVTLVKDPPTAECARGNA